MTFLYNINIQGDFDMEILIQTQDKNQEQEIRDLATITCEEVYGVYYAPNNTDILRLS